MADVTIIETDAIEKILDKHFANSNTSSKEISDKYEQLTGESLQLEDITKEVIEFILEAKIQFNSLSEKTKEAVYSIENLTDAIKNIVSVSKEKNTSSNVSSNSSSISTIQNSFIKMKDSVINGTKRMFDGGISIIKGFFGDISRRAASMMDNILAPFKNLLGAIMVPFKMLGNIFSSLKGLFTNGLSSLFGSKDKENDFTIAGITKKPLNENLIMKRTSIGIAVAWLWKKMQNKSYGIEEGGGLLDTAKDLALLSGKGGILATATGLLGKLAVLIPIVTGVAAMGYDLFNKGKKWWDAETPEEKRDAGEDVAGSASVSAAGMAIGGAIGMYFGGPIGMQIGAALGGGIASLITSDEFKKKVGKAWYAFTDKVSEWTVAAAKMVGRFLDKAWDAIPTWDEWGKKWDSFKSLFKEGWNDFIDLFPTWDEWAEKWNSAVSKGKELWDSATAWVPTWEGIKESFSNFGTSIKGYWNEYIGEPLGNLGTSIAGWLGGIKDKLSSWWDSATSWWDSLWADSKTMEERSAEFKSPDKSDTSSLTFKEKREIEEGKKNKEDTIASRLAKEAHEEDLKRRNMKLGREETPSISSSSVVPIATSTYIAGTITKPEEPVSSSSYPVAKVDDSYKQYLENAQKIHDEELKRLRQKNSIQEEISAIPGLAGINPIEDSKKHQDILDGIAEKSVNAAIEESKKTALETMSYSQMSIDQLESLMEDISIAESEKETIWAELEARKQIDENINKSVTSFSEIIEKLLNPLKQFTEELKNAITTSDNSETTAVAINAIQKLATKFGEAKDKATGIVKDAVGSVSTGPKALGSGSTPLAFDSSKGGIELSGGRYKEAERFNSIEDAIVRTIQLNEGSMNSVNKNDKNGKNDIGAGVSLGFAQWNGGRAQDLLKRMQQQDPEAFKAAMGEDLVKALSDEKRWKGAGDKKNAYKFSAEEAKGFKELAGREDMQKLQFDKMKEDVAGYMKIMEQRGITGAAEQIFYADMMHQAGAGGVRKGTGGYTDLASMYEMSRSFDGGKHANRRDTVFNTLGNLKFLNPESTSTIVETTKVEPSSVKDNSGSVVMAVVDAIKKASEDNTNAITKKLDETATLNKETNKKEDTVAKTPGSTDAFTYDGIPDKILNFMFGVNPGGSYSENIFSAE